MTTATAARVIPRQLIPTTYFRADLRRVLRNRRALIFTIAMPTIMYLAFGAAQDYGNDKIGNANTSAYILIHMAVYGSVLATSTNAASVALEQMVGWTRTLRLTPLGTRGYLTVKVMTAMAMAAAPLVLLSLVGVASGAHAPVGTWIGCLLLGWLASAVFAAFGLAVGLALKSEAAMQVLGGLLTILAFAGGVFIPVKGAMLTFSQFTPMFGVAHLASYPMTHGETVYNEHVSIWVALLNIVVWFALFTAAAGFFYRRGTARQ